MTSIKVAIASQIDNLFLKEKMFPDLSIFQSLAYHQATVIGVFL